MTDSDPTPVQADPKYINPRDQKFKDTLYEYFPYPRRTWALMPLHRVVRAIMQHEEYLKTCCRECLMTRGFGHNRGCSVLKNKDKQ